MTRTLKLRLASTAALWSTIGCSGAEAAGPLLFMGLGDLPGGGFSSFAYGVSADGSVVVGESLSASGGEAFRWTQDDGMVGLGDLPGGSFSSKAFGTSADGSVVVGGSGDDAFRWTHSGGMEALPRNGFPYGSSAVSISANGSVVVGTGTTFRGGFRPTRPPETEAWRWTQSGGLVRLGDLPGGLLRGSASGVSAAGSVVVGYGYSAAGAEAFRWTQGSGMVGLGDLTGGGFSSMASAVSADASVVVGYGSSAAGIEAFRWTQNGGMVGLGILPGFISSRAGDVSADGSVVVGWGHSATGTDAFVWDATHGMRSLRDVLAHDFGLGASLAGWKLEYARGISADGRIVVGYGFNPNGDREAWIARLAPTLPGDFNNDDTVDAADYVAWRKGLGTFYTQNDYNVWRAHVGQTAGSGSVDPLLWVPASAEPLSAAVPEPSTFAFAAGGILGLVAGAQRRRRRPLNRAGFSV